MTRRKDGRDWIIATADDVAWIREGTRPGLTIDSAIPAVFEAYATVVMPSRGAGRDAAVASLLDVLARDSGHQPWWVGYLDTGGDDVVFDDAPRVTLYADWRYVVVLASAHEAARWREPGPWRGPGPDLLFPADRSWLVSCLWDDDWHCVGGPAGLVERTAVTAGLEVRRVAPGEDATPPGHTAR